MAILRETKKILETGKIYEEYYIAIKTDIPL